MAAGGGGRSAWSKKAFSEDGIEDGGGLIKRNATPLFTFVIIRITTYDMLDAWMDLVKSNRREMLFLGQESAQQHGKCSMHIGYLTCNHDDLNDPESIAMLAISYHNTQLILITPVIHMCETYSGPDPDFDVTFFIHLICTHTPNSKKDKDAVQYVFFTSDLTLSNELHHGLIRHGVPFSRCRAYTFSEIFNHHNKLKDCKCWLGCDNWDREDYIKYQLPHLFIRNTDFGELNIPWLTGYAFDVVHECWAVHCPIFASLFKENREFTAEDREWNNNSLNFMDDTLDDVATSQLDRIAPASFLAPAIGAGIIVIDFQHFLSARPGDPGSPSAQPRSARHAGP